MKETQSHGCISPALLQALCTCTPRSFCREVMGKEQNSTEHLQLTRGELEAS